MPLEWVRPEKDWDITHIAMGDYLLTLKDEYVEMTGANVVKQFGILIPHKIKKVEIKHTDNVKADSADNLKITFERGMGLLEALWHKLYEDAVGTTSSDIRLIFEKNYEYPSQYYRLMGNTTNTDRIYLEVYIELFTIMPFMF